MAQSFNSVLTRLGDAVKAFTIAQRTIAIIGVAVLALGIAALVTWSMKPSYTPLFSGLNGEDASIIVEQLRTDNIPYELSAGGGTILVPEESVYDQRLKAAAAGLPSSSTAGYSLLDDMGVTSSEFQESVTYKRALEGELAATVSALEGVKNASVRLAIPEESVFVSEAGTPTASVFIETDSGVSLSSEQVQAVAHLTSASIDGMTPENVAVIDADGTVLSAADAAAAAEERAKLLLQVGIVAALTLLAIIITLVIYARRSRRQRREPVDLGELQEVIPAIGGPGSAALVDLGATRMMEPAPETTSIDIGAIAGLRHDDAMSRKRADVEAMAVRDPAKTAEHLRSLMDDRQPV